MNVEREDQEFVVRLTPFELHVVHSALHQYGEHLLPDAVESAPSIAAGEALTRLQDVSTRLGRELDEVCSGVDHGDE